jgi:hypothetical protein
MRSLATVPSSAVLNFPTPFTETMDTYGHLFPGAEDLGRGVIDAALAPRPLAPGTRTLPEPRRSWTLRTTTKRLARRPGRGESACRPGSVPRLARGGGHPSRAAVAGSLVRSTRGHRAGRPRTLAQASVLRRWPS